MDTTITDTEMAELRAILQESPDTAELRAILQESPDTAKLRLSDDNPSDHDDWPFSGYDFFTDYYSALDADGEPVATAYRWFRYRSHWWAKVGDHHVVGTEYNTAAEAMRAAIAAWRKIEEDI